MNRHLTKFVVSIVAAAAVAGFFVPVAGFFDNVTMVAYLAGLALFAGAARVRIPGLGIHMSAVDPIVFCALAVVGPLGACAVGTAAVIGASIGSQATMTTIRLAFNLGNVFLSTAAGGAAFAVAGGFAGAEIELLLAPLAAAAVVYFSVNSTLTSAVLILAGRRGGFLANWRRAFVWSIPAYVGGMVLGIALYAAVLAHVAWGAGLAVAACWLLVRFFEAHTGTTVTEPPTP